MFCVEMLFLFAMFCDYDFEADDTTILLLFVYDVVES